MPTAADHDTRDRLVAAAEHLFAEQGVGAVSLRAVMQEAGANVASVHYHFGSKPALVEAVVRARMDQISDGRDALLATVDSPDPRALARAFVVPVARIVADGGRDWVRVIGQLLAANDPGLAPISDSFFARNARFVALMSGLEPRPSHATIAFRLSQAMTLTLQVLGNVDRTRALLGGGGACADWSDDDVLAHLLDVVTAVLAGPPAPDPKGP